VTGLRRVAPFFFVLVLVAPSALALSFSEDFEDDTAFQDPTGTFYTYTETSDVGFVTDFTPIITGSQSMKFEATGTTAGNFDITAPSQLTNLTFTIRPLTIDDDGVGSRQVIKVQSGSPTRTMVEFHVYCDDADNPTGCEFRVRFEQVDSQGQVLINTTVGDRLFTVKIQPNWNTGKYQLFVDGVDDGLFPFLQLPSDIGRISVQKASGSPPLNMVFDDWSIDGALPPDAPSGDDIAAQILDFMAEVHFTSETSQFIFGIILFVTLLLAIALAMMKVGQDNTIVVVLVFPASLVLLWLVTLGVWPDWIGIALIIVVSALIGLLIRTGLMGIRDASTDAGLVAGTLGYFIIATTMLGLSGYASEDITLPTGSLETPDDLNETGEEQIFPVATLECIGSIANTLTFNVFGWDFDCSQQTTGETFKKITDFASTVFNYGRVAFTFLFQLLTFRLPIPTVFNVMIVMPPAAALAFVGFKAVTNRGG